MNSMILTWFVTAFKNSKVWDIFNKIYDYITSVWKKSIIVEQFRKFKDSTEHYENSFFYKLFLIPNKITLFLRKVFKNSIEGSFFYNFLNCFLNNMLAMNLRFIGLMVCSFCVAFVGSIFIFRNNVPSMITLFVFFIGVILLFVDKNLTSFIKHSILSKFVSNALDEEINYEFYEEKYLSGNLRFFVAILFGFVAGILSVIISPIIGIGIIVAILGFMLFIKSATFGVVLTVFAAPILPTMIVAAMCILCFISLVLKSILDENFKWKFGKMAGIIFGLLVAYGVMGALFSYTRGKSIEIYAIYFVFISFFFVLVNTITTKRQLIIVLKAFAISSIFVALVGFIQYVFNIQPENAWIDETMFSGAQLRVYGTLENPNVLGEYLLLAIPIAFAVAMISKTKFSKVVFVGITLALCLCMVLTQSRGCWVGLILAVGIMITFLNGKLWGIGFVALMLMPMLVPDSIIARFTSIGNMEDTSSSYRVFIWLGSIAMLKDYWLMGVGLGDKAYNAVYPIYEYSMIAAPHSHNLFLQVWLELGIVGIILLLTLFIKFFKDMIMTYKSNHSRSYSSVIAVCLISAVVGFIVQSIFDYTFYNYRVMLTFFITIAIATVLKNITKVKETNYDKSN